MLIGYVKISWTISQGISYILYPLFGWIADVRVTYYRMINISLVSVLISSLFMFTVLKPDITKYVFIRNLIFQATIVIVGVIGFGMYEANAIQFGMDQMLEASSEQLSSFIHWYYWSLHVGPLYPFSSFILYTQTLQNRVK